MLEPQLAACAMSIMAPFQRQSLIVYTFFLCILTSFSTVFHLHDISDNCTLYNTMN